MFLYFLVLKNKIEGSSAFVAIKIDIQPFFRTKLAVQSSVKQLKKLIDDKFKLQIDNSIK